MPHKPTLEIDGQRFTTLDEFYDEIERVLIPGASWGRNLDAFNDILRGGFGTPEDGWILLWRNSDRSRETLGYPAKVKWLRGILKTCHPSNRESILARIEDAERGVGPTLFEDLVEIVRIHGPGGREADNGVLLELA